MEAYKKWVRENKDYVHSLESLANVSFYLCCFNFHGFMNVMSNSFIQICGFLLFIGLFVLLGLLGFVQFG